MVTDRNIEPRDLDDFFHPLFSRHEVGTDDLETVLTNSAGDVYVLSSWYIPNST